MYTVLMGPPSQKLVLYSDRLVPPHTEGMADTHAHPRLG